jgi:hypothetical protein
VVLLTISHHPERARENEVAHNDLIQEVISSNKKKLPTELTTINDSFINSYLQLAPATIQYESIENQSVLPNEILIADDGSRGKLKLNFSFFSKNQNPNVFIFGMKIKVSPK